MSQHRLNIGMPIRIRLASFYAIYYAIIGTFLPYWNLYLADQGFDMAEIGWLSSIGIVTRCFAPLLWGILSDRTGRRMLWIRVAAVIECVIWISIYLVQPHFVALAIIMLIFSFFQNAIMAQFEGVTLFWLGKENQHDYGRIRQWGSIGFIVAVFGVGWLLQYFRIDQLPLMLLLLGAGALLCSMTIGEPESAPRAQPHPLSIWPVLRLRPVYCFFAIEAVMLLSQAPFYSFYSNYLTLYDYDSVQIGWLWTIGVLAEIAMFACARRLIQRFDIRVLVASCVMVNMMRWIIVGMFPQSLLLQVIAQCGHAFSFGLFHLIAMRIIFQYFLPEQQGRAQAVYSTVWGLGVAGGSIVAGQLWDVVEPSQIFIGAGLITLVGVFWLAGLSKIPQTDH